MREDPSLIHDPAMREQIRMRYEAGEYVALCTEFGITMQTLSMWVRMYHWPPSWVSGRRCHEQVSILIHEGYTNTTTARVLSISADTVRAIRQKINTNQTPPPAGEIDVDVVPHERPPGHWGGWYCGSCSWWGETIDEYIFHTKKHERDRGEWENQ